MHAQKIDIKTACWSWSHEGGCWSSKLVVGVRRQSCHKMDADASNWLIVRVGCMKAIIRVVIRVIVKVWNWSLKLSFEWLSEYENCHRVAPKAWKNDTCWRRTMNGALKKLKEVRVRIGWKNISIQLYQQLKMVDQTMNIVTQLNSCCLTKNPANMRKSWKRAKKKKKKSFSILIVCLQKFC